MITIENVDKTFQMGEVLVPVLRGVNLEIQDGEFIVVVGPSGSGKSTLLNLIGGIDRPTSGRITFDDHDLTELSDAELTDYRREHVGYIFQFYNLVPTLTALENVSVATEIVDEPMDAMEAIDLVGLADRADHFPAQLSGGEQQRVAVARAIAKNPTLLLCDEPTGALDLEIGRGILELLDRLHEQLNTTVVLITHNTAIADMAERIVRIGSGTIEQVKDNPQRIAAREVTW